ncbi:MAG: hypothetical protein JW951_07515, partial [Lentisphaerae bacterium]|nr:hypothetical protein [Lentisphaerota bacterium]
MKHAKDIVYCTVVLAASLLAAGRVFAQAGEGITGRLINGPDAPTPPDMDFDPGPLVVDDADWMHNTLGYEPAVPEPWTPLRRTGAVVRCWGRAYRFDGAFPAAIESAGRPLLSAPATLSATIDGTDYALSDTVAWKADADHRITFDGHGTLGPLQVTATNWIEFDGMLQVNLALDAGEGVTVDRLDLSIPLSAPAAKFYLFNNGEWGGKPLGRTPSTNGVSWGTPWWPFGWVGDEERGLTFAAETPYNWVESESGQVHELTRQGDAVVWTVHILGRPTNLTGRTAYRFGFQATPMKPARRDLANLAVDIGVWSGGPRYFFERKDALPNSWPKTQSSVYPDTPQGIREFKEDLGVDMVNMWYLPARWVCFPEFRSPDTVVKPAIAAWHAAGLKVTAYTSLYFQGYESPVFKRHADAWSHLRSNGELYCKAFNKLDRSDGSNRGYITCCPQSTFSDFMCWGIDYLMRTYDLDGFGYIDASSPKFCYNRAHGCGPGGKPRWPIFAVRRMAQRWWRIVKQYKPDGLLLRHSSENLFSPGLAYVDAYIVGEEFRARTRPLRELDKTRLAITMTGLQWGAHPMWMSQCSGNAISVGNSAWVA